MHGDADALGLVYTERDELRPRYRLRKPIVVLYLFRALERAPVLTAHEHGIAGPREINRCRYPGGSLSDDQRVIYHSANIVLS